MGDLLYITKRFLRRKGLLLCAVAFTVVSCAAEIALPTIMAGIVNEGVLGGNAGSIRDGSAAMLLTVLVMGIAGFAAFMTCAVASERFALDLREDLYQRVLDLSVRQVEELGTGSLITRLTGDTAVCASLMNVLIQLVLEPVLLLIGGVVMMWRISRSFDAVFVCFILFQGALVLAFVYKTMPLFLRVQERSDGMNAALQSDLRSLRLIKAYGGEERESASFEALAEDIRQTQLSARRWTALFDPLVMLVVDLAVACILWMSGRQVQTGGLRAGDVMAAVNYAQQVLLSVVIGGRLFGHAAEARACAQRVAQVLRTAPQIVDGPRPIPPGGIGRLTLEGVSFRYAPGGADVLDRLDLDLERGGIVAVCGGVGCGRTTLARLLCRVYDPTAGRVLIDGTDLKEFRLADVRRRIAVVEKEMDIIEGTIRENLLYGREDIPEEDLRKAIEATGAAEVIGRLPDGMESWAMSLGTSLSGGDRQRLALARALAGRPDVLVMDDCTASLDFATERAVVRSIRERYPELSVVLMTQRVLSVGEAEQVLCLGEGGSVERGAAEELRARGGLFAALCCSQGGAL